MAASEIDTKKRKRKHQGSKHEATASSAADEAVHDPATVDSIGLPKEKPRKKVKKQAAPLSEPEKVNQARNDLEGINLDTAPRADLSDDEAAQPTSAKAHRKAHTEQHEHDTVPAIESSVEAHDDQSALPTLSTDPIQFSELHLNDKTMLAIKDMGFETMTEVWVSRDYNGPD
jgi:ATP-dependent RNA helicase DDX18/HAS1